MEKKLEKRCKVDDFKVGSKYRCGLHTFYVTNIDSIHGCVYIKWIKDNAQGLIYLGSGFYSYEVPLSSLEKELL